MPPQKWDTAIKLLGVSQMTDTGLSQSMRPCLVPVASPLAQLEGGTNMVILEGDAVGQIVLARCRCGRGPDGQCGDWRYHGYSAWN